MPATNQTPFHFKRAGKRRHRNATAKRRADARRVQVARLLGEWGWATWGVQSRIAKELGMHRSTICRDRQILDLLTLHDFEPWQLSLIPHGDRTIRKLIHDPIEKGR